MARINPALLPETEARLLAMSFLDGIRKYYSNPKNVEKFKEWQKCRHEEKVLVSA
jgi:hypothetical protein